MWLRRLGQVRAELKGVRFPTTPEEGFRQMAVLSAASLRILEAEVRSSRGRADRGQVRTEVHRLLARLAHADARRILSWKRERARCFRR